MYCRLERKVSEMEEIRKLIALYIDTKTMITSMVASNPKDKDKILKCKIRPVEVKNQLLYQAESFIGTKAFHENIEPERLPEFMEQLMENFKQLEVETQNEKAIALISKKGTVTVKRKKTAGKQSIELSHNKAKTYLLPEGTTVPFLVDLGVQTPDGKIVKARYDKYRQINRYLEFVQDILPELPKDRTLTIIDFGCGKSYLTFALYYYLKVVNHYDIRVIGLDLKKDVMEHCNALAKKYGYDALTFQVGDISQFTGVNEVDMVVTLHACDVATDYALDKAVKWNARVILSVPCCQHEVNKQIQCNQLQLILKYGLIKERMSALMTDAIRANLLEQQGYETQILEFIDMEHTPKNILIRAVKKQKMETKKKASQKSSAEEIEQLLSYLQINPTLKKLLEQNGQD